MSAASSSACKPLHVRRVKGVGHRQSMDEHALAIQARREILELGDISCQSGHRRRVDGGNVQIAIAEQACSSDRAADSPTAAIAPLPRVFSCSWLR